MSTENLLVELFVEELPPKALRKLGDSFATALVGSLRAQGLAGEDSVVTPYASPRRLAAHVTAVRSQAGDAERIEKLMPLSVGIDAEGRPTPALLKRLEKLGVPRLADAWPQAGDGPDSLSVKSDGKADQIQYRTLVAGRALGPGLMNAIEAALDALPIPKVMSYQLSDGWTTVKFVRPAHGLVALHGSELLPLAIERLALTARRTTQGHRFEASAPSIDVRSADSYERQLLEEGAVLAHFGRRRTAIDEQLREVAAQQGLTPVADDALLDEVTALVERPNVLLCRFEPEFLTVPPECLILTMKANQKYFPLLDAEGKLTNQFLVVSNIRPADPSRVIEGNERVVRPRLADAKFFFEQDKKKSLESRVPGLAKVVYHGKLGTQGDRVQRLRAIARAVAALMSVGATSAPDTAKPPHQLADWADRAALLAKADLLTDMVGEFPELQGVMGGYYARHDGEPEAVAIAVEDHYKPRFAGDELPRNDVALAVALADKLETLVGLFGIGQLPTGDKDPFALRRHALGIVRMLIERRLALSLPLLLAAAIEPFGGLIRSDAALTESLLGFIHDRLAGLLREQGATAQEIDAVLALRPQRLADVGPRLAAVRAFAALPEAAALAAANKRVGNILKKAGDVQPTVDGSLLVEPAEVALHEALAATVPQADAAFERGEFGASLQALAALKAPVDAFFDTVMVNAEDALLRNNRLGLLARLHAAMNRVADLSKLAV